MRTFYLSHFRITSFNNLCLFRDFVTRLEAENEYQGFLNSQEIGQENAIEHNSESISLTTYN